MGSVMGLFPLRNGIYLVTTIYVFFRFWLDAIMEEVGTRTFSDLPTLKSDIIYGRSFEYKEEISFPYNVIEYIKYIFFRFWPDAIMEAVGTSLEKRTT